MSAKQPSFHKGSYPINPWHQLRRRFLVPFKKSDAVNVARGFIGQRGISHPAIGVDDAAGFNGL
jgi:hypothetical protein